jgi:hypothetical protein
MAPRTRLSSILPAICAALTAAPAAASVYAVVQSSPDEITVLDPAAVEAIPGGDWRRASNVAVKRNLVTGGPPQPGYVRTVNDYDCAGRRIRWRSFFVYSKFGALILHKDNTDLVWQGADSDAGLRTVCGDTHGEASVSASSLPQLVIGLMATWQDAAAPPPPLQPAAAPAPPARKKARAVKP